MPIGGSVGIHSKVNPLEVVIGRNGRRTGAKNRGVAPPAQSIYGGHTMLEAEVITGWRKYGA